MSREHIQLDIAIVGGGIAGLWLLNRLRSQGYNAALFEKQELGAGQTLASQGMIHGGIKYSLGGALSRASEAIADMPRVWGECFDGRGEVDLSGARILSDRFYMFASRSSSSKLSTFFASKLTRGRVEAVSGQDLPELFQGQSNAQVYKLLDMVVDVPSLLHCLAAPHRERIFKLEANSSQWHINEKQLRLRCEHQEISAKQFIFCAGQGNGELLQQLGLSRPAMQLRPLQQVMVKHKLPYQFYGHCMGAEKTPRLTISSHPSEDGSNIWYLGGSLAEKGAELTAEQLIANAKSELKELFPWLDFSAAEFRTLKISRAEPRQKNFARPDQAFVSPAVGAKNAMVAWPTKLALTPNLASECIKLLEEHNILPTLATEQSPKTKDTLPSLAQADIAQPPWEHAFRSEEVQLCYPPR